jgi:6,7-dimethyl-8-ribityllumazine synthase
MATHLKNLSKFDPSSLPSAKNMRFAIIVSEWNKEITESLLKGAFDALLKCGTSTGNIIVEHVPGSFEIPYAAKLIAEKMKPDAVICLGCVIQGETRHFDFICQAVTQGITELNLHYYIPFIFGILTTQNIEQARERAGGKHGNKGIEAAVTAIKMIKLKRKFADPLQT